jgi:hypothetical protein
MIIASFFLRVIPLPTPDHSSGLEDGAEAVDTEADRLMASFADEHSIQTPLLLHADLQEDQSAHPLAHQYSEQGSEYHITQNRDSLELSPIRTRSPSRSASRHAPSADLVSSGDDVAAKLYPDLHGVSLWTSGDFWLLSAILSLCMSFLCFLAASGRQINHRYSSGRDGFDVFVHFYHYYYLDEMFIVNSTDINNVGSMSIALSAKDDPSFDKDVAAKWQAAQVSTLSIMNFCGRIFIGELLFSRL